MGRVGAVEGHLLEVSRSEPRSWSLWTPALKLFINRYTQPTLTRVERVLSSIIGQPTVVYPSGISAFFAVLLLVRPDVIAITEGYHGCHASLEVYRRLRGEDQVVGQARPCFERTRWLTS